MTRRTLIAIFLPISLVVACGARAEDTDSPGIQTSTAKLAEGDQITRCFPGTFDPVDAPKCEAKSGSHVFEIDDCHIKIERKCELLPTPEGYRCCCRVRVVKASDGCDDVTWSDIAQATPD